MAGGNRRLPAEIKALDPTSSLSKEELKERTEAEIKIGSTLFPDPSPLLRRSKAALRHWRKVISLYVKYEVTFVTDTDAPLIERYCLGMAEYERLVKLQRSIIKRHGSDREASQLAMKTIALPATIAKQLVLVNQMAGLLFLTPQSKITALKPLSDKVKPADPDEDLF